MGTGKTCIAISLLSYLIESKHNHGPFLIIAPLSTISNWMAEFHKWAPNIIVLRYIGSQDERASHWKTIKDGAFNVLITSFDFVWNLHDRGKLSAVRWQYLVVDEGQMVRQSYCQV